MADPEPVRTRAARHAAELALVRVVHHYGVRPEFVLLGGLVPDLLCSDTSYLHAGTTDIDVQVDLEITGGSVNTARLEQALRNAEFVPSEKGIWRWTMVTDEFRAEVKFELLADQDDVPTQQVVSFDDCAALGAVNLRGTGVAAKDTEVRQVAARDGGILRTVELQVTGLAGYLLAKAAAARQRRKPKDLYDIAFVLLHNDAGGPAPAASRVLELLEDGVSAHRTDLVELRANFTTPSDQGPKAYGEQFVIDHPEQDPSEAAADALVAVQRFCSEVLEDR